MIGTATELAKDFRSGVSTPVEALEDCIERISSWEPHIRAMVFQNYDLARTEARARATELAEGQDRGPLHGVPVVIKDLIDVRDMPTHAGSALLAERGPAQRDAPVVARLRRAGAVVIGKSNTHEFAFGALTPPTRNPWDTRRMPGGSSGGTAALIGAGCVPLGLGTDTAGSVREPATLCGLTGLKPTYGSLNCSGVIPLSWSLDTVGPMARSAADCALIFQAMVGADQTEVAGKAVVTSTGEPRELAGLRVAIPLEFTWPTQDGIEASFQTALTALSDAGAVVTPIKLCDVDELIAATFIILGAEALSYHRRWYAKRPHVYSDEVRGYLELGVGYTAVDLVDAQRVRADWCRQVDRVLAVHDVIATPAQLVVAPMVQDTIANFADGVVRPRDLTLIRPLAPFSLSGHPALTMPVDLVQGLPTGIQLVGKGGRDGWLLSVAKLLEYRVPWSEQAGPRLPAPV